MFWKFDLQDASQVEKLLEKEDVTLMELLKEDDVLQECKAQNQRLLLFLTQDSSMMKLLHLITQEPPADQEEKLRYKYANIACELLTCDVSMINDKVGGDESLLNILYGFLEQSSPLNPLLASFFSKTLGTLITRKTEQLIGFLKKKEDFVGQVLKHMDTSAMMDLLLRLISAVEPVPARLDVLNWLNEEKLMQRLIGLIHPHSDEERQWNASQTLCDVIHLVRDQAGLMLDASDADPLITTLELQENVESLLKNMFAEERSEVSIICGTQVLLALLETRRPVVEQLMDSCSQGLQKSCTVNNSILMGIQPHLKLFHHLLLNPPKKRVVLTSMGVVEEPFGNARLHVCRLLAALLFTRAPRIHQELCRLRTINLLLDLFFHFSWNNFLHVQVEHSVSAIISHSSDLQLENATLTSDQSVMFTSSSLLQHLMTDCRLIQRILDAWDENEQTQAAGGMRKGYMGHLTRIANIVVQNVEKEQEGCDISRFINSLPQDYKTRWGHFISVVLAETNKKNTADLVFSDYQMQQMTENFVDQFGLNDDEFGEHDGSISGTFDQITEISFKLVDERATLPIQTPASDKARPVKDTEEEEEDIWEEKEINYATQVKARSRFGPVNKTESSIAPCRCVHSSRTQGSPADGAEQKESSDSQSPGWTASFQDNFGSVAVDTDSGVWGSSGTLTNDADPALWGGSGSLTNDADLGVWGGSCAPASDSDPDVWGFGTLASDGSSGVWGSSSVAASDADLDVWGGSGGRTDDFQAFCCSDATPRCNSDSDKHTPDATGSVACGWNVCGSRKSPRVTSDSSSSDSDSEKDKEKLPAPTEKDKETLSLNKTTSDTTATGSSGLDV